MLIYNIVLPIIIGYVTCYHLQLIRLFKKKLKKYSCTSNKTLFHHLFTKDNSNVENQSLVFSFKLIFIL